MGTQSGQNYPLSREARVDVTIEGRFVLLYPLPRPHQMVRILASAGRRNL